MGPSVDIWWSVEKWTFQKCKLHECKQAHPSVPKIREVPTSRALSCCYGDQTRGRAPSNVPETNHPCMHSYYYASTHRKQFVLMCALPNLHDQSTDADRMHWIKAYIAERVGFPDTTRAAMLWTRKLKLSRKQQNVDLAGEIMSVRWTHLLRFRNRMDSAWSAFV